MHQCALCNPKCGIHMQKIKMNKNPCRLVLHTHVEEYITIFSTDDNIKYLASILISSLYPIFLYICSVT